MNRTLIHRSSLILAIVPSRSYTHRCTWGSICAAAPASLSAGKWMTCPSFNDARLWNKHAKSSSAGLSIGLAQ
jgi:hypothetical protein